MKRIFFLALVLFVLLPFSLALTCADAGITSFAQSTILTGNNLTLDINVSYKSDISVFGVEVLSPDSKILAAESSIQALTGAPKTALVSRTNISLNNKGAFVYRIHFYPASSPLLKCISSGSFTVIPVKEEYNIPDTNIFVILASLFAVVIIISLRRK